MSSVINNFNTLIVATLLASMSNIALASTDMDKNGVYFDIGGGMGIQSCDLCEKTLYGFGGKVAMGWRFNQHLALEAGAAGASGTWTEEYSGGELSMDSNTSSFFAAVVGIMPLNDRWEVFGRLGVSSNRSSIYFEDPTDEKRTWVAEGHRATNTLYGIGVGYTKPLSAVTWRLEYNHLGKDMSTETDGEGVFGPSGAGILSFGAVIQY